MSPLDALPWVVAGLGACGVGAGGWLWRRERRRVGAVSFALGALALGAGLTPGWLRGVALRAFGPPQVALGERFAQEGTETFDHGALDALLRAHVRPGGWVDYGALREVSAELDAYLAALESAPFEALSRDGKLACWINAYNAATLRLILDHYPVASIQEIPAAERWDAVRWRVAGEVVSLNQLEHERIRPSFREPRIHFALVCAAVGCPPLRSEAYTAERLEAQLEEQAQTVFGNATWYRREGAEVRLTQLLSWYGGDFAQVAGSVSEYVARYDAEVAEVEPSITWLDYDWALNGIENATTR